MSPLIVLDALIWLFFAASATGLMVNASNQSTRTTPYWLQRLLASLVIWWSIRMFLLLLAGKVVPSFLLLLIHLLLASLLAWWFCKRGDLQQGKLEGGGNMAEVKASTNKQGH